MNILQTALEAIELLLTDNSSEQAQAAAADARIKIANAMAVEPVAWITTHEHPLLCYTKAEADTFCSNDESSMPLYLHPLQAKTKTMGDVQEMCIAALQRDERTKVGDSRFESWYSELNQAGKGSKQIAREAYEAGLNEADAQQAEPYDQQAMELCQKCGWKGIFPGEPCLVCNMQAKQADKPIDWSAA